MFYIVKIRKEVHDRGRKSSKCRDSPRCWNKWGKVLFCRGWWLQALSCQKHCQVNSWQWGRFIVLAMAEAVTNILLLIFLILLELNCSCWQITSQLSSEKEIWHTLSFAPITERKETELLIPSIFSTMRFSKLSQKDSITIQKQRWC